MNSPCFGIDLGTTNSSIARVINEEPRVLAIEGHDLLPSVLSLDEDDRLVVGHAARNRLALAPQRSIRSAKRKMGSDHRWDLGSRDFTPPQVAAEVLKALIEGAGQHGPRPERAVITVPAWFPQAARADTRRAGELAGLVVERIINEPTAAALAHAHGQQRQRCCLVYDLGGGTFDVSLVRQDGPILEVLASHGDLEIGGDDMDRALCDRVLERMQDEDSNLYTAIRQSVPAMHRLEHAVERARIELSSETRTTLRVPFLLQLDGVDRHLEMELTRAELDEEIAPLLSRTLECVNQVLNDAPVSLQDVDELLLVGGASRTPRIWHLLRERLGREASAEIPADKAVVLGAAIQAALIDDLPIDGILIDVAPYSLSTAAVVGGILPGIYGEMRCRVITPRNSPLPARHTEVFQTMHAGQTEVRIPVFQGSNPNPLKNTLLAQVSIDDLPPAPAGRSYRPIAIGFRHDLDGMVSILVTDELSGRTKAVSVAADGQESEELRRQFLEDSGNFLTIWQQELVAEQVVIRPAKRLDAPDDSVPESIAPGRLAAANLTAANDQIEKGPASSANHDDMEAGFAALLAARERLRQEHPASVSDSLLELALAGQGALVHGRQEQAQVSWDKLSDQLFELGIYL